VEQGVMAKKKKRSRASKERERGGATFECPECGGLSKVKRTKKEDNGTIVRERECLKCGFVFETVEKAL
jgi:transcription elongation factor Elf1